MLQKGFISVLLLNVIRHAKKNKTLMRFDRLKRKWEGWEICERAGDFKCKSRLPISRNWAL